MEATLSKLTSDYQHAIDEKVRCQREADATSKTIALANRLVNGLASEKVRWSDSVQKLREQGAAWVYLLLGAKENRHVWIPEFIGERTLTLCFWKE